METPLTRLVENYYNACETKDRAIAEDLLSADFIYTSPTEDHIDKASYFKHCWPHADSNPVYDIKKMHEHDHEIIIVYECNTVAGNHSRNVEIFSFEEEKIRAIEVFFGRSNK